MTSFMTLYRIELKRASTLTAILLFVMLTAMNTLVSILSTRGAGLLPALTIVNQSLSTLLQLGLPILAVGVIANDIKDHWLRSLLVRPVTRTAYLFARLLALYSIYAVVVVITAGPMVQIIAWVTDREVLWNGSNLLSATLLSMSQGMLVLMISAGLSVWLPGIMNIVVLALWTLVSVTVGEMLENMYWDSAFITSAVQFIFPSGFMDASNALLKEREGVLQGILWGIAALASATALTMWSINKKTIETGSD